MKNYYGHGRRKQDARVVMWRRIKWLTFLALIGAGLFFAWQLLKDNPEWSGMLTEYRGKVTGWIQQRKQKINTTVAKVRQQVGEGDGTPAEVKFEFYNTLQDMKAMQAESKVTTEKVKVAATPKPKRKISHADDLENDILATMKKNEEQLK